MQLENLVWIIKTNKYYKLITLAGVVFLIYGFFFQNLKSIQLGMLSFIYGIFAWMVVEGFHIKAEIKLSPFKKLEPIHFLIAHISIQIVLFIVYAFLVYIVFY